MILDVFDSTFKRIGNIKKFEMATYTDPLNSKGSFTITFGSNDDAKKVIENGKYILLEKEVMGEIQGLSSSSSAETNIVVKGPLVKNILSKRCIPTTFSLYNNVTYFVRALVNNECINPVNEKRKVKILKLSDNDDYIPVDNLESKMYIKTGGEVLTAIEEKLEEYSMGYDLVPLIKNIKSEDETKTNVENIEFRVLQGKDRSRFNTDGNNIVEFSLELKNLLASDYSKLLTDYKNVAYVAGQGKAENRIVKESGETEMSDLDRIELYVDARDLQQEELSDIEYEEVLIQRGSEKLAEHKISETFNAIVDQYNKRYKYGKDYYKGDWVSIKDINLPIVVKAQITKIIKTVDSKGTTLEVTFGTEKMSIFKKIKRGGIL